MNSIVLRWFFSSMISPHSERRNIRFQLFKGAPISPMYVKHNSHLSNPPLSMPTIQPLSQRNLFSKPTCRRRSTVPLPLAFKLLLLRISFVPAPFVPWWS